jgi:hypothetical protein
MKKIPFDKYLDDTEKAFNPPNIYDFLVKRGISTDIADDAQAFIDDHFVDSVVTYTSAVEKAMEKTEDWIQGQVNKFLANLSRSLPI